MEARAEIHHQEAGINWESPLAVSAWLQKQLIPVSAGIDCIDEREKLEESILTIHDGHIEKQPIIGILPNDGAINFPGMDAGIALMIMKTLRVSPLEAVKLTKDFAAENGRDGLHIHTDQAHILEKSEKGCGVLNLLGHDASKLGINATAGKGLVDAIIAETAKPDGKLYVASYKGAHSPDAWVINRSTEHTFKQYDKQGNNVFLIENARVEKMIKGPGGLASFINTQTNQEVAPNLGDRLYKEYLTIVDSVAPLLAGGKPVYDAHVSSQGAKNSVVAFRRGNVPLPMAA